MDFHIFILFYSTQTQHIWRSQCSISV